MPSPSCHTQVPTPISPSSFSRHSPKILSGYPRNTTIDLFECLKQSQTFYTMHLSSFLISALSLMCTYAAPAPQASYTEPEEPTTTDSTALITSPTAPYRVISVRSGSPIHLLPMQARGFNFYLGGSPSSYCPQPLVTSCPSGEDTIYSGLGGLVRVVLIPASNTETDVSSVRARPRRSADLRPQGR